MEDLHIHSTFSDGRDTLADNLEVAVQRQLTRVGFVDHVRRDSTWVPLFTAAVRSVARGRALDVVAGVEAKLLDRDGALDLPERLDGVDRVYIADHQLPTASGPRKPQWVRRALRDGSLSEEQVLDILVDATAAGLRRSPRPAVVAHLFSLLPKVGLDEGMVSDAQLAVVVEAAAETGAWVELDERWRCPGPRVARAFLAAGVPVVLSTDSHTSDAIGRYQWAPSCLRLARRGQRHAA